MDILKIDINVRRKTRVMSNKSIHEQLFSEIMEEVRQIESTVLDTKRLISENQREILIYNRIRSIIGKMNRVQTLDVKAEEFSEYIEKFLESVNQIVLTKLKGTNSMYRYNLETLRYSSVCSLMTTWGKGGVLRIVGIGNTLINMLIGFETMDDVEKLLVDFDHPEFRKRNQLVVNFQNFATGMYYIITTSLYNITERDLRDWSLKALKGNEIMLRILEKNWNVARLKRIEERTNVRILENAFAVTLSIYLSMTKYLLLLYPRIKKVWTTEYDQLRFIELQNTEKFLITLKDIVRKGQAIVAEIEEKQKSKFFGLNDNPLENEAIKVYDELLKGYDKIIEGYLEIAPYINEGKKELDLGSIIEEIRVSIEKVVNVHADKKLLLNRHGDYIEQILRYMLFLLAIQAIEKKRGDYIEEKFKVFKELFFTEEGKERYPNLYYKYLMIKLITAVKEKKKEELKEISEEMVNKAEYLLYHPRDEFSFTLLGNMVKYALEEIEGDELIRRIQSAKDRIQGYITEEYDQELNDYIRNTEQAIIGEEPAYNYTRVTKPLIVDHYSILIPNLKEIKENVKICYLPFNLESDCIEGFQQQFAP